MKPQPVVVTAPRVTDARLAVQRQIRTTRKVNQTVGSQPRDPKVTERLRSRWAAERADKVAGRVCSLSLPGETRSNTNDIARALNPAVR